MTSNTSSEEIHTGVVAFRPGSLTPFIREIKGENIKMVSAMVEDYGKLRSMEGQEVRFTMLINPYGPYVASDHGFAKLL